MPISENKNISSNTNYNNNFLKETKYKTSYSQEKTINNHTLRSVTNVTTHLPTIRQSSPSYPSYYKSS